MLPYVSYQTHRRFLKNLCPYFFGLLNYDWELHTGISFELLCIPIFQQPIAAVDCSYKIWELKILCILVYNSSGKNFGFRRNSLRYNDSNWKLYLVWKINLTQRLLTKFTCSKKTDKYLTQKLGLNYSQALIKFRKPYHTWTNVNWFDRLYMRCKAVLRYWLLEPPWNVS